MTTKDATFSNYFYVLYLRTTNSQSRFCELLAQRLRVARVGADHGGDLVHVGCDDLLLSCFERLALGIAAEGRRQCVLPPERTGVRHRRFEEFA